MQKRSVSYSCPESKQGMNNLYNNCFIMNNSLNSFYKESKQGMNNPYNKSTQLICLVLKKFKSLSAYIRYNIS